MATRKGKKSSLASIPPEKANNFLTPEAIRDSIKSKVFTAYIEPLGGSVHYHSVGADIGLAMFEEGISMPEKIRRMARLVSESLCNADGSPFISQEEAIQYPIEILDEIIGGIAEARKDSKGNA